MQKSCAWMWACWTVSPSVQLFKWQQFRHHFICSCQTVTVMFHLGDADLFSKSCIFIWVVPTVSQLSNHPLGLRQECHYGRWLQEKRDKTVWCLAVVTLEIQDCSWCTSLYSLSRSLPVNCSLWTAAVPLVSLLQSVRSSCSNGDGRSMSWDSHSVRSMWFFFSGYWTRPYCITAWAAPNKRLS